MSPNDGLPGGCNFTTHSRGLSDRCLAVRMPRQKWDDALQKNTLHMLCA